jgi:hypothetical protein
MSLALWCCLVASQFGKKEGGSNDIKDFACNTLLERNKQLQKRIQVLEAQLSSRNGSIADTSARTSTKTASNGSEQGTSKRDIKLIPSWSKASITEAEQSTKRANAVLKGCSWESLASIDLSLYDSCNELVDSASKSGGEDEERSKDTKAVYANADRTPLALEIALCEAELALEQWIGKATSQPNASKLDEGGNVVRVKMQAFLDSELKDGAWEEMDSVDDGQIMGWKSKNSRTCYTPGDGNSHPVNAGPDATVTQSIHPTRKHLQHCLKVILVQYSCLQYGKYRRLYCGYICSQFLTFIIMKGFLLSTHVH